MGNKILIDVTDANQFDAGTKARNDVYTTLAAQGFTPVVMFHRVYNNAFRMFEILKATYSIGENLKNGDLIVLQYPYQPMVMQLIIRKMKAIKKKVSCQLIVLIHDINYLRNEKGVDISEMRATEISLLNCADALIVHNGAMKNRLHADGVSVPMHELGVFDYIYEGALATHPEDEKTQIVFAGNLSPEKSGFLYQSNTQALTDIQFNLYGSNVKQEKLSATFAYKGSFPPDDLIKNLQGDYGLVWDGASSDTCSGVYGEYLRYNNPHKLSLYLAAGLPVVVWVDSALADFVMKSNVGRCVSVLSEVTMLPIKESTEYQAMIENVALLSKKLQQGVFLRNVFDEL